MWENIHVWMSVFLFFAFLYASLYCGMILNQRIPRKQPNSLEKEFNTFIYIIVRKFYFFFLYVSVLKFTNENICIVLLAFTLCTEYSKSAPTSLFWIYWIFWSLSLDAALLSKSYMWKQQNTYFIKINTREYAEISTVQFYSRLV